MKEKYALNSVVGIMRVKNNIEKILKEDIKKYKLNMTEFAILEYLYNKGEKTVQEIVDKILVVNSTTTYTINKLEEKKYIKRRVSKEDKRIIKVKLTKEGLEIISKAFLDHKKSLIEYFDRINLEEIEKLLEILKKLEIKKGE